MRIRLAGVGQGQRSSRREQTPSLVNTLRKCQFDGPGTEVQLSVD